MHRKRNYKDFYYNSLDSDSLTLNNQHFSLDSYVKKKDRN